MKGKQKGGQKRGQAKMNNRVKKYFQFFVVCCFVVISFHYVTGSNLNAKLKNEGNVQLVSRMEIIMAMKMQKGYDITAATNGARFSGQVILQLARWARERDPEGPPLLIDHKDSFWAYLDVTGLGVEQAPIFIRLAYQHKQDQLVEYRTNRVIKEVKKGPQPELAVNVKAWWPKTPGLPSKYSYIDTFSRPILKVTNRRVVTYRLLDFGNILLYDDIHGVSGRPKSGPLGLLFQVIGEGRAVRSQIAITQDGLQVTYSKAKKWFISVKPIATIFPDGRAEKNIPDNRPDLSTIVARLKRPLEIKYMPFHFHSL